MLGRRGRRHWHHAGYAWRIAVCGGCKGHLGWAFQAPGDGFHGLIVDRLRPEPGGER